MRVVVFGATGNVGRALVRRLSGNATVTEVVGVARRTPVAAPAKVRWQRADVRHSDLRPLVAGADAVVNLAWLIQPQRDRALLEAVNVAGGRRVLDAVLESGVPRLICASSVGAYAAGPKGHPVDESWPATGIPTSQYARHKAALEHLLDTVEADRPDVAVVRMRTALVFQRSAASEIARLFLGRFVPTRSIGGRRVPLVPASDRLVFQCVHADDAAAAYEAALEPSARGAYNVAAGDVLDSGDLAEVFGARSVPVPAPLLRGVAAAGFHLRLLPIEPGWLDLAMGVPTMDCSRIRDELGWRPQRSGVQSLEELLDGFATGAGHRQPPLDRNAGRPVPLSSTLP